MFIDEPVWGYDVFLPVRYGLWFLSQYGWYLVMSGVGAACAVQRLRPVYRRWKDARDDAEYHKDPDKVLARLEAVQRAREAQQRKLAEESQRAREQAEEREARKREEMAERIKKYGNAAGGQKLGAGDDYLPLSGGASSSTYRPPKKSKCGGGGCGR